jgi:NFU1 iron-sulfur cluster scaffold homolog, mitochondrial
MADVTLTPVAKQKLDEYLREEPADTRVRLLVEEDGRFGLSLDTQAADDFSFEVQGLSFVIEQQHEAVLEGLRVDYLDQGAASGFALTGGRPPAPRVLLRTEPTPNPDAMKFVLAFSRGKTSKTWTRDSEDKPAVIGELFGLEGVESVFELDNFVTINRVSGTEWDELIAAAKPIVSKLERPAAEEVEGPASDAFEDQLHFFIRSEVAPFLQADGGDIELVGYEEGTVKVRLNGACGSCPSSIATLQFGVERRLKEKFPEQVKGLELMNPMGSAH